MELPVLTVSFDDGTTYEVAAKPRDLLAVEKAGIDLTNGHAVEGMYAVALSALARMQRTGEIPADVKLPESVDALADVADVEGKAEGPQE